MDFNFHQHVSSVLAILFITLLSTLLGIITVSRSDEVVSGFSETVVTHAATLKK
jgi:hypothetical protein